MPNNQFLTVQDVYNPADTALKMESLNEAKLRNRVLAMQAREMFQQQTRRDRWNAMANNPFNPVAGQFTPTPTPQPQMQPQPAPMPAPTVTPAQVAQAQQPTPPALNDEDKAAIRGYKKLQSMSRASQPLVQQAKTDGAARARLIKMTESMNNDADHQALVKKSGYDEMNYTVDPETGEGAYNLAKNWTADELQNYAEKAPNGQALLPLTKHPGKYRIKFDDNGAVVGYEFIKQELGKKTQEELIDLSLHGTSQERIQAQAILDKGKKYKTDISAAMAGNAGLSTDAIEYEAERLIAGEPVRSYGYGKYGAAMRAMVLNRVAEIAQERGIDASEIIAQGAELGGQKMAMKDVIKRENLINTFVTRIDSTSDLVMKMAQKVGNLDNRLLNIPRNQLRLKLGSGDYRAFELALYSLSAEIGKVETGQLGISAITDTQLKLMNGIHDPNLSLAELQKLINGGKALGKTAMDAIRQQRRDLKSEIGGKQTGQTTPSAPPEDDPLGLR